MRRRCQELQRRAIKSLDHAYVRQKRLLNCHGGGRKRDRETAEDESAIQNRKRMACSEDSDGNPIMFQLQGDLRGISHLSFHSSKLSSNSCTETGTVQSADVRAPATSMPTDINDTTPWNDNSDIVEFPSGFSTVASRTSNGQTEFPLRAPVFESLTIVPNYTSPEFPPRAPVFEFLTIVPNYTIPELPSPAPVFEPHTTLPNNTTQINAALPGYPVDSLGDFYPSQIISNPEFMNAGIQGISYT